MMRSGAGTRNCCPLEVEKRRSNSSAPLVGNKVSAAEMFLRAFTMGGSEYQSQVSESADVPFFPPNNQLVPASQPT